MDEDGCFIAQPVLAEVYQLIDVSSFRCDQTSGGSVDIIKLQLQNVCVWERRPGQAIGIP
jgi:hypothetical protein